MTMMAPMDDDVRNDRQAFDDLVTLVQRGATEACAEVDCLIAPILDRCVEDAVASLWSSPIRTYVPLLALRAVQDCCRNGACPDLGSAGAC